MSDIIEKLGITPIEKDSIHDFNCPNCFYGMEATVYSSQKVKDIELQRNKMLEALIKILENEYSYVFDEDFDDPLPGSSEEIAIREIQKATGKPWKEIKELLNE